jgi:hypothetical protein
VPKKLGRSEHGRALVVGAAGLLVGILYALRLLIPSGFDPTVFVAFGEDASAQTTYAERLVGPVHERPLQGHDGKFFFIQANDPWYLDGDQHAVFLDRPVYRGQRMLYPQLASVFGLLSPNGVIWGLLVVNVVALGVGSYLTARVCTNRRVSAWIGLAFALNLGILNEVDIDGGGAVAFVFAVGAVAAADRRRFWLATGLLTAAVLTREVFLLFAAGMVVAIWLRGRLIRWQFVVVPAVAGVAWGFYLRARLGSIVGQGSEQQPLALPFSGLIAGARRWTDDPINLVFSVAIILVLAVFAARALRSRDVLAWGALGVAALAPFLSQYIWAEWYDISRAIAPVFTAYVVLVFTRGDATMKRPSPSDHDASAGPIDL